MTLRGRRQATMLWGTLVPNWGLGKNLEYNFIVEMEAAARTIINFKLY